MSKGSTRRPTAISRREEDLRWKLAFGEITKEQFITEMERLSNEKDYRKSNL